MAKRGDTHRQSEAIDLRMLEDIFFTEVRAYAHFTIAWHEKSPDHYSNFAAELNCHDTPPARVLDEITQLFVSGRRSPVVLVTPFTLPAGIERILEERGFRPAYRNAWMYFKGRLEGEPVSPDIRIEEVKHATDMQIFVTVFNRAYSGAEPDNPHGAVPPQWGETLLDSFGAQRPGRVIRYYILSNEGDPASVLLTVRMGTFGGIYSAGTDPEFRRRGYSSLLTTHAIQQLLDENVKEVFLQTESGTCKERFYRKLGFATEWTSAAWKLPKETRETGGNPAL